MNAKISYGERAALRQMDRNRALWTKPEVQALVAKIPANIERIRTLDKLRDQELEHGHAPTRVETSRGIQESAQAMSSDAESKYVLDTLRAL